MSEFTDATIGRYVDQDPEQRKAYALDPAAHMRVEALRQTLDAVERAMAYEDVPDEVRRRVINRVVWGEPEGLVDARARVRDEVLAAYDLPTELTDAWKAIRDGENVPAPTGDGPCRATLQGWPREVVDECVREAGHYNEADPASWHQTEPGPEGTRRKWSDSASGATPHSAGPVRPNEEPTT